MQDVRLANCVLRIFVPDDIMGDQKAPALLWFHGGENVRASLLRSADF